MSKRYGPFDGKWAKVEIMGHVDHIARCLEVPLLDGKAIRVCDEMESGPILYGLGAIFSLRWLTDDEGEKASATRAAEHADHIKRAEHGAKIGTIQQMIRDVIDGKHMTMAALREATFTAAPNMYIDDFAEAVDEMGLDEIPGAGPCGVSLYWIDPDSMPF